MSLKKLIDAGVHVDRPKWLDDNICYETMMGSVAYGVSNDSSDMDVYGAVFPPKELVFPHITGEIPGFGQQVQRFDQWQKTHIQALEKSWDFSIYGVVRFFQLAMENNPNMLDALFVPRRAILSITPAWEVVRENRRLFLHKGSWPKFKGYAYSQLAKIRAKNPQGNRVELVQKYGYDVKFAYHVVRILSEGEQILLTHDLDIEQNREQLKSIRRGEWSLEQLEEWAKTKEKQMEAAYAASTIPAKPDEPAIRQVLVDCLEHHYGSLANVIASPSEERRLLGEIARLTRGY